MLQKHGCQHISQNIPHVLLFHAFHACFQLHSTSDVLCNVLLCEQAGGSRLATVVDKYIA